MCSPAPQVLATWRLYLFTVKVPTKVSVPQLPLANLDPAVTQTGEARLERRGRHEITDSDGRGDVFRAGGAMTTPGLAWPDAAKEEGGWDEATASRQHFHICLK